MHAFLRLAARPRSPPSLRYPTGGIDYFVKLGGASKHQEFFTNPAVKALYKKHIAFMAGRVNSINGRKYSEDPTIMAWCVHSVRAQPNLPAR